MIYGRFQTPCSVLYQSSCDRIETYRITKRSFDVDVNVRCVILYVNIILCLTPRHGSLLEIVANIHAL
jgi:hypothetical protein